MLRFYITLAGQSVNYPLDWGLKFIYHFITQRFCWKSPSKSLCWNEADLFYKSNKRLSKAGVHDVPPPTNRYDLQKKLGDPYAYQFPNDRYKIKNFRGDLDQTVWYTFIFVTITTISRKWFPYDRYSPIELKSISTTIAAFGEQSFPCHYNGRWTLFVSDLGDHTPLLCYTLWYISS